MRLSRAKLARGSFKPRAPKRAGALRQALSPESDSLSSRLQATDSRAELHASV